MIHPSQWLSIILRFISRTVDDYRSFVSFLNIKAIDSYRDNHTLHIIISAISETTEDLTQQNELINVIVESQFKNIINGNPTDNEIFERTVNIAQQELDKKLSKISEQFSELSTKMENAEKQITTLSAQTENKSDQITDLSKDNVQLKNELKDNFVKKEIRQWKYPAYLSVIATVILLLFYCLQFFLTEWQYNYVYKLIDWIDNIPNGLAKNLLYFADCALAAIFIPLIKTIYIRLFSKKGKEMFFNNINIPEKYK